jgi:hypothetical protein
MSGTGIGGTTCTTRRAPRASAGQPFPAGRALTGKSVTKEVHSIQLAASSPSRPREGGPFPASGTPSIDDSLTDRCRSNSSMPQGPARCQQLGRRDLQPGRISVGAECYADG